MKTKMHRTVLGAAALSAFAFAAPVLADEDAELIVNGDLSIVTKTAAPAHLSDSLDEILSGWRFRNDDTQVMQMDDFDNPGMLGADVGLDQFAAVMGSEGKSCADCHDGPESLSTVRATYPKWNEAAGEVRTMQMQINDCLTNQMGAEAEKYDSAKMLNFEAMLAVAARGTPVNVAIDGPAQSVWETGKELYYTRFGQLELSCANCHEDNYGNMIRADHLSQGQVNGFPTYRLKNAKLNGIQSRFKGCVRDTRAETFNPGSPEFIALELYVASRGNGLSVEGPSVRN
ncbi:sulfur oxidation c-type cytochrome SoxA [Pacificibacter marinus]|uniref:SoxAX cytochrome complex subunit A n=1 Tax=Pacificibacter marinus TaxID=658057 RepID=A0A1Y5RKC6_9RHOB|nr:sulfur oxidation c-type cytochrome SoxA [Pacificibacter marinus]SEK18004.1 sulfur-oxidizing protein SoxA [Pacificibacter marinus]SLN19343.1 SoxAX cytochrome complex subunit A precursor [Pacificibacter marinus]